MCAKKKGKKKLDGTRNCLESKSWGNSRVSNFKPMPKTIPQTPHVPDLHIPNCRAHTTSRKGFQLGVVPACLACTYGAGGAPAVTLSVLWWWRCGCSAPLQHPHIPASKRRCRRNPGEGQACPSKGSLLLSAPSPPLPHASFWLCCLLVLSVIKQLGGIQLHFSFFFFFSGLNS